MGVHKGFFALVLLFFLWLGGKFLLPFLFPFLLGAGLALASEPVVSLGISRLHLKRTFAAGLGVTLTLIFLSGTVFFLGALAVRELGQLAAGVPGMVRSSAGLLEDFLVRLTQKIPEPAGLTLTDSVHRLFRSSSVLTDRAVQQVPGLLSGVLGKIPGGAMTLGTGILSGYFISARLPRLKERAHRNLPKAWQDTVLPALKHLKESLGKWLIAQGKLMTVTYGIVALGLTFLRIPYAFAWAILVAAVDAVPLLGTGVVLLPWALTKLLQGQPLAATGMFAVYLAAMITRTVLEPKFFGRHLGVDPLVMLLFLYAGYRLWGFWGIVISPLLAATTKALTTGMHNADTGH